MSSSDTPDEIDELKSRIEELESRVDEPPDDSDGWNVQDLTQLGLSRREALYVLAAMAAGYTFREAFLRATEPAAAGSQEVGDIGTADKPVDAFLEDVVGPSGTNPVTFQNDIQAGSGTLGIPSGIDTPSVANGGAAVSINDDLDFGGAQSVTNAASVDTDELNNDVYATKNLSGSTTDGIQEAVNEAGPGGTAVAGPPGEGSGANGEFLISSIIEITTDNTTLLIPEGSVVKSEDGTDLASMISVRQGEDVRIRGAGTLDANQANQAATDSPAVFFTDDNILRRPLIEGLTLTNTRRKAIEIATTQTNGGIDDWLKVRNVTSKNHEGTGGGGAIFSRTNAEAEQVLVEGFTSITPTNGARHIIISDTVNFVSIADCVLIIDGGSRRGIRTNVPTFVTNSYIGTADGTFLGAGTGDMIGLTTGPSLVWNNAVVGTSDRGIVLGANTISADQHGMAAVDNLVWRIGNPGIEVIGNGSGGDVVGPVVENNTVLDCNQNGNAQGDPGSVGVNVQQAVDVSVADNQIGDTQAIATQEEPIRITSSVTDLRYVRGSSFGHATSNDPNDSGTRTRINGIGQEASNGTPTAANWHIGDLVEDTQNAGDVYVLMPSGSFTQVAT